MILLISASWVARIIGVSHWHPVRIYFLYCYPPFSQFRRINFCSVKHFGFKKSELPIHCFIGFFMNKTTNCLLRIVTLTLQGIDMSHIFVSIACLSFQMSCNYSSYSYNNNHLKCGWLSFDLMSKREIEVIVMNLFKVFSMVILWLCKG
jgi:hypothetical protein